MARLKSTALAGVALAAMTWVPSAPAVAGGPLLFAPWALSHIVAPFLLGAALSSLQPPAPYPAAPGYYGGPAAYYSPAYVQRPGYYAPPAPYYPRGYYGHTPSYRPAFPGGYPLPRGAYPQRLPYHASYGGNQAYRSGGYGHRGW